MLKQIPNEDDLQRVYYELAAIGARCIGKKKKWPYKAANKYELLALAAEMSRFDPRLFEILVDFFITHWKEINPKKIRDQYGHTKDPQVFCVIGEFLKKAINGPESAYYADYLADGTSSVPTQFFFHSIYNVGGKMAQKALEESLAEYKRWGFLATERPTVEAEHKGTIGTLDSSSRLNVLRALLARKKTIQVSDYLKALGNSISRQQALIDLKKCNIAAKRGKGRGSYWKMVA